MTYRNRNFTKRDYERANIVACVADAAPVTSDNRWEVASDDALKGLTQLYIENGVRYFGYL